MPLVCSRHVFYQIHPRCSKMPIDRTWLQTQVDAKVPIFLGPIECLLRCFFYKLDTVTWVKVTENKCRNRGMLEVFGIIWPHLWHDVWWGSSPIGNLRGNFNLFYSMCLLEGKALTFPSLCTYSFCLNHRNASTFAGCSPFQTAVSWLIHGVY